MDWTGAQGPLGCDDGNIGWERPVALVRAGNRIGAIYLMCAETGQGFHAAESAVATLARVLESPAAAESTAGPAQAEMIPRSS